MGARKQLLDGRRDHSRHLNDLAVSRDDVRVARIGSLQLDAPRPELEVLADELAIDHRDHHVSGSSLYGLVDDEDIAVKDAGVTHRIATSSEKKPRLGLDQLCGQVDSFRADVFCGAGEAIRPSSFGRGRIAVCRASSAGGPNYFATGSHGTLGPPWASLAVCRRHCVCGAY